MTPVLRAAGIRKHYGGVHALTDGSLELLPGEVHALVGENGAGKSTLARILAGLTRPDSGHIELHGRPASFSGPTAAQRLGVAIVLQELDLFPHLSVADNIVIANAGFRSGLVLSRASADAFCRPFLEMVGLDVNPRRPAGSLSLAQSQLLALARALSMQPRVLIMDEPTSALFDDAAAHLFSVIASLKSRGIAVLYVSHKMDEIFRLSDRITVLRDGASVGVRDTASTSLDEIVSLMAGRPLDDLPLSAPAPSTPVVLSVSGLSTARLKDVSFDLHRGEVLGVAGLVGSGRSSLARALFGLEPVLAGSLRLDGAPFRPRSPFHSISSGIGLVPEDRKGEGLMLNMSVLDNTVLAVQSRLNPAGVIGRRRELAAVMPLLNTLSLRFGSYGAPVGTLSGGNQQKVLLARWLLSQPKVLILDDPARGIDIAAKHDLYRIIRAQAASGAALLFISSELPELLRCSDRILVLNEGRVAALAPAAASTQESIVAAACARPL